MSREATILCSPGGGGVEAVTLVNIARSHAASLSKCTHQANLSCVVLICRCIVIDAILELSSLCADIICIS